MSGFTFKNHDVSYPIGSIIQHYGTSDPDGWIICNGVTRTSTDGRYARLATLLNTIQGVSTNNANSVTPPNLKGKFLYGSSNTTTGLGDTGGAATQTLTVAQIPSHTHTGTTGNDTPDHSHGYRPSEAKNGEDWNGSSPALPGAATQTGGASTRHTHGFTTAASGGGQAFSILPPYFLINHIMKY